ncbi:MAG: NAD-binding protein [Sulfurimonas sp.]|jgi:Trk K+ transport system NAD-binding subunit|nr:NAD-binding protein [Sulfurimonas sp.]
MKEKIALIFGNNEYASEIKKNLLEEYETIRIFTLKQEEKIQEEKGDGEYFDLSDDWSELTERYDMQSSIAFCALEDDAQNIFLCISLRAAFEHLKIIALSSDKESAHKMEMAGATKVIPLVQTTADIIVDMLEKPITTQVLHNILYGKSDLKIAQIKVEDNNYFNGKYPSDIEWSRDHGVLVLSIMDEEMNNEFIYSSKAKHHPIKNGDIFVVVGYERDIQEFDKLIRSVKECK